MLLDKVRNSNIVQEQAATTVISCAHLIHSPHCYFVARISEDFQVVMSRSHMYISCNDIFARLILY